jgi:hypothetical protein
MRLDILRALVGALLLLPVHSWADQMVPLSVARLAARAQLIVQGRVLSSSVQRDEAGRIYTAVQLQVDETWKGTPGTNQFLIVHGGGALGDQVAVVSGEATYQVGEEIVAFLVLNQHGAGVSIGLSQGKFQVEKDPVTGEKLAHNRFHGLAPTGANPPANGARALNRLTLAELKRLAQEGTK